MRCSGSIKRLRPRVASCLPDRYDWTSTRINVLCTALIVCVPMDWGSGLENVRRHEREREERREKRGERRETENREETRGRSDGGDAPAEDTCLWSENIKGEYSCTSLRAQELLAVALLGFFSRHGLDAAHTLQIRLN
jgi:hypothetical protein